MAQHQAAERYERGAEQHALDGTTGKQAVMGVEDDQAFLTRLAVAGGGHIIERILRGDGLAPHAQHGQLVDEGVGTGMGPGSQVLGVGGGLDAQ